MAGREDVTVSAGGAHVLLVEDDPTVAEVVSRYLEREGYSVDAVTDGSEALALAERRFPDLVVLDIMLPGLDGLEVCRRLRALAPIPVIMLSARGDEQDRVVGLELGADDYLAKPFSPRELMARVHAVLRRASSPPPDGQSRGVLESDGLVVDLGAREVCVRGEVVSLTAKEFELLAFLAQRPRKAFRRDELLEYVWGFTYGDASTVTVHIRRLREKIEDDPSSPARIATVWGVGYRFDSAVREASRD